jgi:EAL domain-containing protein (putative c-di-GMP-specific phosphodiesterase class I)
VKLDHFVWEEACKVLAKQKATLGYVIPVSVNVSRVNFYNADFFASVMALLKKYDLEPWMLKLEITETAYTENPRQLLTVMRSFQEKGFKILMDDFGSGYSSLNMLKNVPVDILKVDMGFVQDVENSDRAALIMKSIVQMAEWIHMGVVIEGVETKPQLDFLEEIGCNDIQGYYFSKPLPVEMFESLISREENK